MNPSESKTSHPLAGREDEIERRYRSGESMPSIAADFGVSKQAIQKLLGKRGVAFADRRASMDARIRILADQGSTVPAIAKDTGLTPQTVRATLYRIGLVPTWDPPKRHRLSVEMEATIVRLRMEGATISAIAEVTGVSSSAVSKCLVRSGLRSQEHKPKPRRDREL